MERHALLRQWKEGLSITVLFAVLKIVHLVLYKELRNKGITCFQIQY